MISLMTPFYDTSNPLNHYHHHSLKPGCKTYAIKRQLADKYIVDAANAHASVSLLEMEIDTATLDPQSLLWTVTTKASSTTTTTSTLTAKMLLVCDGSTSYLGQKLGLVPKGAQPEAQCSHAYVKRGIATPIFALIMSLIVIIHHGYINEMHIYTFPSHIAHQSLITPSQ